MTRMILGVSALAASIAAATPAAAVVQFLTFSGTLNNNSKTTAADTFGYTASNTSLNNKDFSVTLSYDATAFANTGTCGSSANTSCTFTLASGIKSISETIKVNGVEKMYTLDSGTFTLNANGNDQFSFSITNNPTVTTFSGQFTSTTGAGFFPNQAAVNTPLFNVLSPPLALANSYFTQQTTSFYVQANSGQVTSLGANNGAVPEPAAWTMMILGFGALGFVMRRQRAAVSFA